MHYNLNNHVLFTCLRNLLIIFNQALFYQLKIKLNQTFNRNLRVHRRYITHVTPISAQSQEISGWKKTAYSCQTTYLSVNKKVTFWGGVGIWGENLTCSQQKTTRSCSLFFYLFNRILSRYLGTGILCKFQKIIQF